MFDGMIQNQHDDFQHISVALRTTFDASRHVNIFPLNYDTV